MTKEITVMLGDGTVSSKKVNSVEELEELNKSSSIHPKSILVHYSHPFNADLLHSKGIVLNSVFPTLSLVGHSPFSAFTVGSLSMYKGTRLAVALQFDLEELGLGDNRIINEILNCVNGLNYSSHPLGYVPSGNIVEDRKGVLLYNLLMLEQYELVDKYSSFLENTYCPINTTKEVIKHMEELNAILNNRV